MPTFLKKPALVQAEQWTPENKAFGVEEVKVAPMLPDRPGWTIPEIEAWVKDAKMIGAGYGEVTTPEGSAKVHPGDWLVKGSQGELYPVKKEIFEATYRTCAGRPVMTQNGIRLMPMADGLGIALCEEGVYVVMDDGIAALLGMEPLGKFIAALMGAAERVAQMSQPRVIPATQMPDIPPPGLPPGLLK